MLRLELQALFNLPLLFDMQPVQSFRYDTVLLFFYAFLSIISIAILLLTKFKLRDKKTLTRKREWQKIARVFLTLGLLGAFFVLSDMEQIAFFAMRFLMLLTLSCTIGMAIYFVIEWVKYFPLYHAKFHDNIHKQQYLPKRKKR